DAEAWTVGAGIRFGTLSVATGDQGDALFELSGSGLEVGGMWRPPRQDLRVGVAASLPITGTTIDASCDPMDCEGYILPEQVAVPWQVAAGVAWRLGESRWNQW